MSPEQNRAKNVVLIASLGRTDLQVLVERDGKRLRASVGTGLRVFHQALLDGEVAFRIDPHAIGFPEVRKPEDKPVWDVVTNGLQLSGECSLVQDGNCLSLVPAKLATAAATLRQNAEYNVIGVVLLTTCRGEGVPKGVFEGEPVATGPIMARWLAECFGLEANQDAGDIRPGRAGWVHILDGTMLNPGAGRDYPVSREAMRRVEDVMRRASAWQGSPWACLSLGGGMPEFKEPIKACAQYYFDGRTFNWQSPQYAKDSAAWMSPEDDPPTPTDSYRIRRHVEHLVRRGSFMEAAGVASELAEDLLEHKWTKHILDTSRYFSGILESNDELPSYIRKLLYPFEAQTHSAAPLCFLAAMRTEAALQSNRIPEAISWTCTFHEIALVDAVAKCLPEGCSIDISHESISCPITHLRALKGLSDQLREMKGVRIILPLTYKGLSEESEERYIFNYDFGATARRRWMAWIKDNDKYLGAALTRFMNTMYRKQQVAIGCQHEELMPSGLRNINTHGSMTTFQMQMAWEIFNQAGLWKNQSSEGLLFLRQELVKNILKSIGIPGAPGLYNNLVSGLCRDLRQHRME